MAACQGEIINSNAWEEANRGLAGLSTKRLLTNAARTVSVSNENGKQMSECWGIGQVDLVALFFPRTTGKKQLLRLMSRASERKWDEERNGLWGHLFGLILQGGDLSL